MNLTKRYEVTFIADGAVYKKGEKCEVNLALASKFFKQGKITPTSKMLEDAKELGCEDLFVKGKTTKSDKE